MNCVECNNQLQTIIKQNIIFREEIERLNKEITQLKNQDKWLDERLNNVEFNIRKYK